jgi:transcriptional regulator with XRE-family HTH domain
VVGQDAASRRAELVALGLAVKRRRNELGWTLDMLAEESGVSRGMLVAIEHGTRNAGILSIIDIASAMRLTPSGLLDLATADSD